MWEAFRKYSLPAWQGKCDPALTLAPDVVLGPFINGLRSVPLQVNFAALVPKAKEAVGHEYWPWHHSLYFVRDLWRGFGTNYGLLFDKAMRDYPAEVVSAHDAPYMKSGGRCLNSGIEFCSDETLSDPVYLARESAHLMAMVHGGANLNVRDIQASFMQEAAYQALAREETPRGMAARQHRLWEYTALRTHIEDACTILKGGAARNVEEDRAAFYLHRHPFAGLLAISMYEDFKDMPDSRKNNLMTLLYRSSDALALYDVVGAFDIRFEQAGIRAAAALRNEAQHFNVLMRTRPQLILTNAR